ncbi:unnamed protein product, partial [Parascedosporium putredinis]
PGQKSGAREKPKPESMRVKSLLKG